MTPLSAMLLMIAALLVGVILMMLASIRERDGVIEFYKERDRRITAKSVEDSARIDVLQREKRLLQGDRDRLVKARGPSRIWGGYE